MNDLVDLFQVTADSVGDFDSSEAISGLHHNDFPLKCGAAREGMPPREELEDRLALFLRVPGAAFRCCFVPEPRS
ncbi:MAG: hypothetical protein DWI02_09325 [Planctomycetota bacterium]|nr:MAG: hypothetical protein DWI02_09325 [Planctomycetota bacterium]